MTKVITYGTYDLLHYGHIRLLERAKVLGDYLIVGVTADGFDVQRGKINVQQPLMERIEAVKATGLADEIIVEEYEGQKIDDIRRYGVDIFTVGSDWTGKFDYLNEYCKVIYLPRTEGVSSSEIRGEKKKCSIAILGESSVRQKFEKECSFVNGAQITDSLENADAVYINSAPAERSAQVRAALEAGKHVLCEAPIAATASECAELYALAKARGCVLMDGLKTAYATAYQRLLLLVKSGKIGDVISVDAVCTSMAEAVSPENLAGKWSSIEDWGPIALLPVFQLLGTQYTDLRVVSHFLDAERKFDGFTKLDFTYPKAVASVKVAKSAKSEGELVISGTKGYIYVPAPWWKTDYFEVRCEDQTQNQRYFYQLEGEGIRYEIVSFIKSIETGRNNSYVDAKISQAISKVMETCRSDAVTAI